MLIERGPLSAADIRGGLRSAGFSQSIERLAQLPDRFPHRFDLTPQGLLSVASAQSTADLDDSGDEPENPDWYKPPTLLRVSLNRVAVLDIETTGLQSSTDFISELALVRLNGETLADLRVKLPEGSSQPSDGSRTAVSISEALRLIGKAMEDIDLLIGHNLLAFDVPFLNKVAERSGVDPPHFPTCADSLHLATLVDVAMPNRSLADLTDRFGISNPDAHHAQADATATAAVVRCLLDEIDVSDPNWQLAIGVLETFDHPLAAFMPAVPSKPELSALTRKADPLLVPSGSPAADAWSATRDAFESHRVTARVPNTHCAA